MPSRTAYAGTALDGDVYTAANHARMPGGWIGYAEITSDSGTVSSGSGVFDISGLSVTVEVNTSRRIRITGHGEVESGFGGTASWLGYVREGSTTLGRWGRARDHASADELHSLLAEGGVVITPSAGSHTYKLSLQVTPVYPPATVLASDTNPAWILVEDLGPAS